MNIQKSYEALAADLASEKIISKTLLVQKESYMMLADKGRLDLSESKAREAALREELAEVKRHVKQADMVFNLLSIACQATGETTAIVYSKLGDMLNASAECDALQQRLTVAERALKFYADGDHLLLADADAWDTCSGEPVNFLHDEAGTASVEDGSIAKAALKPVEGEGL